MTKPVISTSRLSVFLIVVIARYPPGASSKPHSRPPLAISNALGESRLPCRWPGKTNGPDRITQSLSRIANTFVESGTRCSRGFHAACWDRPNFLLDVNFSPARAKHFAGASRRQVRLASRSLFRSMFQTRMIGNKSGRGKTDKRLFQSKSKECQDDLEALKTQ
jgi:hypothetical protein